jgi:WD40 repeat protein
MRELVDVDDLDAMVSAVSRWRARGEQALLIVDQFEELFTLNPHEVQARFAELLGRLVLEADVFVLLSMRDDFFFLCHGFEALKPLVTDLTLLGPPAGAALRRALVQPATKCGYRFEDDELVDEMLAEVEGERGALPLLAFAMSRLWDKRDRDHGLLTRQAYHDIGGVGGSLARHAEATLEKVGTDRLPLVRELFRNLVTAEGTRAVRGWNELLSVFGSESIPLSSRATRLRAAESRDPPKHRALLTEDAPFKSGGDPSTRASDALAQDDKRRAASDVLRQLIDARLLTSYEIHEEGDEPARRVEIIHESLLANWPRLVRWQTQDADAVQLRDQLRQAARTWQEHDRSDDLLWIGSAFREYQLWRERYPGGLTETEEAFAAAMTSLATRRKRRQRMAVAAGMAVLLAVLAVVTTLWRQSVLQTRRAEAAKLLALGEIEIDTYPTAALAWATSSLELAESREGRLMTVRALSKGPPVTVLPPPSESGQIGRSIFRLDGKWLATRDNMGAGQIWLNFEDGRQPVVVGGSNPGEWRFFTFESDNALITARAGVHQWWSAQDPTEPQRSEDNRDVFRETLGAGDWYIFRSRNEIFWITNGEGKEWIHSWRFAEGAPRLVGGMEPWWWPSSAIDGSGSRLAYSPEADRTGVYLRSLVDWGEPPRRLGEHNAKVELTAVRSDGQQVASLDQSGEIRVWPTDGGAGKPVGGTELAGVFQDLGYGPTGRWVAAHGLNDDGRMNILLLDLAAPWGAAPLELRRSEYGVPNPGQMAFHPRADWLFATNLNSGGFWPLTHPSPWVFDHRGRVMDVLFTPDSKWLLSLSSEGVDRPEGQLRAWPLDGQNGGDYRVLLEQGWLGFWLAKLAIDPSGEHVAVGSQFRRVCVVPVAGGQTLELAHPGEEPYRAAFSPDGRFLATVPRSFRGDAREKAVRVWNLETGEPREIGSVIGTPSSLRFVDDRHLLWSGGVHGDELHEEKVFDLVTGEIDTRSLGGRYESRIVSSSGSHMLAVQKAGVPGSEDGNRLIMTNLATGRQDRILSHGENPQAAAIDPSEQWIVTGGAGDGLVRVGPISGEEPHVLYGHQGKIWAVAFSPDGRWIASAGDDKTVRLWPMPDMTKPPLHTLPHDELIVKLKTLTNLRVVRDEKSPTGWKLEVGPFPGWETVPTW